MSIMQVSINQMNPIQICRLKSYCGLLSRDKTDAVEKLKDKSPNVTV